MHFVKTFYSLPGYGLACLLNKKGSTWPDWLLIDYLYMNKEMYCFLIVAQNNVWENFKVTSILIILSYLV